MKNLLLFNYNIDIEEVKKINDDMYSFYIDYIKFYFIKINRPKKDIIYINEVLSNTFNKFHYMIKNVKGNLITEFDNKEFVLLKINGPENNEIELIDILNDQFLLGENSFIELNRTNWGELWSSKVDYLEYQVSELGQEHMAIRSSFSYYAGLAENAIQYFNILDVKNAKLSISHRRINYPNYSVNFYNPLNIVEDFRVRDVAEYLKFAFFNGKSTIDDLTILINKGIYSDIEYNLLYARLLFPTYYFDMVSDIFEGKKGDDDLLLYVERAKEYEIFLKEAYENISKRCSLFKVDWLIDK